MALYGRVRNTRLLVLSLVMLSLVTITVDYRGGSSNPLELAGRGARSVVGAMQSALSRAFDPAASFVSGLLRSGSLQEENERLKDRVRALEQREAQIVAKDRQIASLSKLLDLKRDLRLDGVGARVIASSPSSFEWSVTIDQGSAHGIHRNMAVVSGNGLVGRVVDVAPNASEVQLIIDPDSAVAARLASSGETGLVKGQTDTRNLGMDLVAADTKVFPNELVETSGYVVRPRRERGVYPPNIPIGYVSHVAESAVGLTKSIEVRPAVDFSSLEFVLVLTERPKGPHRGPQRPSG